MKKSVLTSLIAATALFSGVAFAGNYADENYAQTNAAATSTESGWLDGMYFGLGVNHSANNKSTVTAANGDDVSSLDTTNYGWDVLVGKNLTETFAIELGYSSFGKNTFKDDAGQVTNDYYQQWATTVMGVVNSASYHGFSAHAKGGVAYLSEKGKDATGSVTSYASGLLAFGAGLQYQIDRIGVSFDWTRFQDNNTTSSSNNIYIPDQYSLNVTYTLA